jgi:predicted CoA-binding protein
MGVTVASRAAIEEFVGQRALALVGVSRNGQGFGNIVRKELAARGYDLVLVHPGVRSIGGQPCAARLSDLAGRVEGVVLVTPPDSTTELVREAAAAGIRRVWMQQGAESEEAIRFCQRSGLSEIHGECILMYTEPRGIHSFHRWLRGVLGRLPA